MPGIILFGRRWKIGSDDFVFPGVAEIILKFVWMVILSVVYHYHKQEPDTCQGGLLLKIYFIGFVSLLCVTIFTAILLVYSSMQGSVVQSSSRSLVVKLLYIKIVLAAPEIAWNVIGSYWAFAHSSGCAKQVVNIIQGVVISGWVIFLLTVLGVLVIFDPLGGVGARRMRSKSLQCNTGEQVMSRAKMTANKVWFWRCRVLCCCLICDNSTHDAFQEIAAQLAQFFEGVDLVPTDIAAGLVLVHLGQREKAKQLRQEQVNADTLVAERNGKRASYSTFDEQSANGNSQPPVVSHKDDANTPLSVEFPQSSVRVSSASLQDNTPWKPSDWMEIPTMLHYMKFVMGSYGWPLYVFANLGTGVCRLCSHCRCCRCSQTVGSVMDDNCCMCNTSAIRKWTNLHEEDILFASFHNEIYAVPFYVALDRKEKAVVVAVRGTMSLKDALTDMTADSEEIDIGSQTICTAHRGIYTAAKYVKSVLDEKRILDSAFSMVAQGYRLVVTGHSLGAGVATLLAILLKPSYPELICYAFSPPGGLLCEEASVLCSTYVCSIVLGNDLVPRLGLLPMENLKQQVLTSLSNSDVPKYKILAGGFLGAVFCTCIRDKCISSPSKKYLLKKSTTPSTGDTQQDLQEALQNSIEQESKIKITYPPMFPPGRVLHIQELDLDSEEGCCVKPQYFARWKKAEEFQEIKVSPNMISDHLPDNVLDALQELTDKEYTPKYLMDQDVV